MTNNEIYLIDIYNELGKSYNPSPDVINNLLDVDIKTLFSKLRSDEFKNIIDLLNDRSKVEIVKTLEVHDTIINDVIMETEIDGNNRKYE